MVDGGMIPRKFSSLDSMTLTLMEDKIPYKRCVTFHALLSSKKAVGMGWIKPNDILIDENCFSDMDKDNSALKAFVKSWRDGIPCGTKTSVLSEYDNEISSDSSF